jgi:hypothetical protein
MLMGGSVGLLLGDWVLHVLRCLAKFVEMVVIQPLIAHGSILALILGRSVLLGRCVISCLGTGIVQSQNLQQIVTMFHNSLTFILFSISVSCNKGFSHVFLL